MAEPVDATYFTPLRHVTSFECITGGIDLTVETSQIGVPPPGVDRLRFQVHVIRPDLLRLRCAESEFDERPTFAVCAEFPAEEPRFEVTHNATSIRLETSAVTLVIGRAPFRIDAFRADGSVLFETADVNGEPGAFLQLNDEFLVARKLDPRDGILGLGEKTGPFNRNGRRYTLWNADVLDPDSSGNFTKHLDKTDPRRDPTSTEFDPYYISIPFFYRIHHETGDAAGFFIDNGHCGRFEFDVETTSPTSPAKLESSYRFHFTGGQYTEYIFAGPSIRDILAGYTWLTGRMALPPVWALGYHQCRWHPYDHEKLTTLGEKFRKRDIPCDSLWLDIDHMHGYRVYTWNQKLFPHISKTVDELDGSGFRVITIVDPGVKYEPGYPIFDEGAARGLFCKTPGGRIYTGKVWPGKTAFPDFVKEETREWWGRLTAEHIGLGIAGIWNDMNEPATGKISPDAMRFVDGKYPHETYHNQYGFLMAMATRDGMLAARPDRRTFILSRAGFAGIQRYAANWMGDNMARWDHLKMSISMALGLGLSGQPFVGADIGGFAENCNKELLIRWMEYGALTPFCRNHNNAGCRDQYPWTFGADAEQIIRESIQLRYRLMPTLYAAFIDAARTGAPVQRALAYDYQDDPIGRAVEDQYLLGPNLLVAPICRARARKRRVYLPEGSWHDWHTGETFAGRQWIVAEAPIERIPLFVKGGAIVPMWPNAPASTSGYQPREIELHVFPPTEDGQFRSHLQEDDGLTFAFENDACYRTELTLTRHGSELNLRGSTQGNGYPEFGRSEFTLVFHAQAPSNVVLETTDGSQPIAVVDSRVHFANSGQSFQCAYKLA